MKTRTLFAAIGVAGAVAIGAAVAIPALAAPPPGGNGPGFGPGPGTGMMTGPMGERGGCLLNSPSGTLTDTQRSTLAANAEEEKLAHDLYTEFANRYDAVIFDRIAAAETHHLDAVRTLLTRYQITDPTAGLAPGRFATPAVQASYDQLLARGATSERAALEVGQTVETNDIAALQAALDGLTAPDVQRIYTHLITASQHHLTAFTTWLSR
ncbi:MAG TPA: DUF2202 domain-containing protein [Actinophytocola sp.]|uniref:DUF2202 domain-containing protein n=1 Tax=Actinophytocola sp. TaxID=1872138 RepID=UPI002DBE1177|nr:DUF2202 domain-containing protein [Actinophytocola sp.]HEU5474917.1 DUF2202 domain-containing protein [Actinophytocola sp.]